MKWANTRRRLSRWLPASLRGRFVIIMIAGVLVAQGASYAIWTSQVRSSHLAQLDELSTNMAFSIASTMKFFRSLPVDYRHIVLDQLRNMGGTRFFVSVNERRLAIDDIGSGPEKQVVVNNVRSVLTQQLNIDDVIVEFSRPENLRVLNNEVLLYDLPPRWGQHSLLMEPLSPPILVVQLELAPDTWLYVATLLGVPDIFSGYRWLSEERLLVGLLVLLSVLALSFLGISSVTRPLARLSRAAHQLGDDLDMPPLKESGPKEVAATAAAFNRMQRRIREQIEERERLFSAISHDLKTPLTRMRLRAEMLDDDYQRERFCASLDELDSLVKGALASVKGLDLHEEPAPVSLASLLEELGEELSLQGGQVTIEKNCPPLAPLIAKPMALKRCLANLLENAVFYGKQADVALIDRGSAVTLHIRDHGPGIPEEQLGRVFSPFVRLEPSRSRHTGGSGLGLGIARHIARAHGGDITLANHADAGLVVTLTLPRQETITGL
ncbi:MULTISPECIES: ATP-binding protein [unclassified Halomonas]|uniref:ATP-binding protein n=1 Tax=unclassified Halomonas TaxID=2609666 RepID=UPI0007D8DDAE|nr:MULTISPECIES: ATP-binding protein [unclassified Halomonas]MBT2788953.1 HAMP domain-containing protein [Halomonas sp. ISL-106]MBT2799118.1 HAMP domain-containing protein [Halomonas sp. ISL-104]OAL60243.1 two-component sensor histidine kinase [Halomonas sp. ALS9]